jgi:hypothetical protein
LYVYVETENLKYLAIFHKIVSKYTISFSTTKQSHIIFGSEPHRAGRAMLGWQEANIPPLNIKEQRAQDSRKTHVRESRATFSPTVCY